MRDLGCPLTTNKCLHSGENAPRPDAWCVRTGAMRHFDSSRSSWFSLRNELCLSGVLGSSPWGLLRGRWRATMPMPEARPSKRGLDPLVFLGYDLLVEDAHLLNHKQPHVLHYVARQLLI